MKYIAENQDWIQDSPKNPWRLRARVDGVIYYGLRHRSSVPWPGVSFWIAPPRLVKLQDRLQHLYHLLVEQQEASEWAEVPEPGEQEDADGIADGISWVSSKGVLRVPERVLKHMGLEHGGDVVFSPVADGGAELRSTETFLRLAELPDDGG